MPRILMSFLIPMNINDDIPLVEMAVIRRCLSKNGGKGWYEDECKRSGAAMSWWHIEVKMMFYFSISKEGLGGKRPFSSNLGCWQFGISIEDRSRVPVSMKENHREMYSRSKGNDICVGRQHRPRAGRHVLAHGRHEACMRADGKGLVLGDFPSFGV